MGYDGHIMYGDVELVNIYRSACLASKMGLGILRYQPTPLAWIADRMVAEGRARRDDFDVTNAPWYSANHPASAEFAGLIPLGIAGLDDSSLSAETLEFTSSGGSSGTARNTTQSLVWSAIIIAKTERGADYGKRWIDKIMSGPRKRTGRFRVNLTYLRTADSTSPLVHRRLVSLTRGTSVTRKTKHKCASSWLVTFTMTCDDPFEYTKPMTALNTLGGTNTAAGPGIKSQGSLSLAEETCSGFDYTPLYDPQYPALVSVPRVPDFYPDGWDVTVGEAYTRYWARINSVDQDGSRLVPKISLTTGADARMVRVSIWDELNPNDVKCGPLFSVTATYVPAGQTMTIDGEQERVYAWDGSSALVRLADSVVFGMGALPIEWASFTDRAGLLITLDVFTAARHGGDGSLRANVSLIGKTD